MKHYLDFIIALVLLSYTPLRGSNIVKVIICNYLPYQVCLLIFTQKYRNNERRDQ